MAIKKVETFWWAFLEVENRRFRFFAVQATFLPASTHKPNQICIKGVFWYFTTTHQISSQILTGKIYS